MAKDAGLDDVARMRKQDIIFAILKAHAKSGEDIFGVCGADTFINKTF